MNRIVGIRWRKGEPVVYADAGDLAIWRSGDLAMKRNTMVVVQAVKGQELGIVVREPATIVWSDSPEPPALTVLRRATASDIGRLQQTGRWKTSPSSWRGTRSESLHCP